MGDFMRGTAQRDHGSSMKVGGDREREMLRHLPYTEYDPVACVKKGAQLLDQSTPGWADLVPEGVYVNILQSVFPRGCRKIGRVVMGVNNKRDYGFVPNMKSPGDVFYISREHHTPANLQEYGYPLLVADGKTEWERGTVSYEVMCAVFDAQVAVLQAAWKTEIAARRTPKPRSEVLREFILNSIALFQKRPQRGKEALLALKRSERNAFYPDCDEMVRGILAICKKDVELFVEAQGSMDLPEMILDELTK